MSKILQNYPVVTIDGPSGTGKGTVSHLLAHTLGWNLLDSGALYRVLALAAEQHSVDLSNEEALNLLAAHLDVQFVATNPGDAPRTLLEGVDVTDRIRTERCGNAASILAAFPGVRSALLERQRAFRDKPGLVTDGRDMGTVVFPDAEIKIYLDASAQEKVKRRQKQLNEKGFDVSLAQVSKELEERDKRDKERKVAPLICAEDATRIDTTGMTIEQVLNIILSKIEEVLEMDVNKTSLSE